MTLKTIFLRSAFPVLLAAFAACDDSGKDALIETPDVQAETASEAYFEDVDDLANSVSLLPDMAISGRQSGMSDLDDRFCANLTLALKNTVSSDPDTVVVNFGAEGCTDPKGNVRKGKLLIIFTGDRKVSFTTVFDGFYLNGKKVEGSRSVSRISTNPPTFTISLQQGKITWPDGTFATRESNLIRVFNRNLLDKSLETMLIKSGSIANGVTREGKSYTMEITTDLLFKRSCMEPPAKVFVPVSGVKTITIGGKTLSIDYGDGTCDKLATITRDGVSKQVTLDRD